MKRKPISTTQHIANTLETMNGKDKDNQPVFHLNEVERGLIYEGMIAARETEESRKKKR